MASTFQESKLEILKDRAHLLAKVRQFFHERSVLEVDCPIMSHRACVDLHIDLFPVLLPNGNKAYLHSSPEYGMKRVIASGMEDIYQLCHVFRSGEVGDKHNPEFTMCEWYRLKLTWDEFIEETLDFMRLFLGDLPSEHYTYRELFQKYLGFDSDTVSLETLRSHLSSVTEEVLSSDKDTLLQLLMSLYIEPHLGQNSLSVVKDFPLTQAALAKVQNGVALRFEVYIKGMELSNGYYELTDPVEQQKRFEASNQARLAIGKEELPIDERFVQALHTFPSCCGVAVGFDRLMMLRHNLSSIRDVLPLFWDEA